jgi:hypothetical protein
VRRVPVLVVRDGETLATEVADEVISREVEAAIAGQVAVIIRERMLRIPAAQIRTAYSFQECERVGRRCHLALAEWQGDGKLNAALFR